MDDDQQTDVEETEDKATETETEEQEGSGKKVEQKPTKTQGPNEKEQVERLKRQNAEVKAELEKRTKERDEALAQAKTAEDVEKLKQDWANEKLRMEVLQENGLPLSASKKISGTTREAIQAEIDEIRSWVGTNGKAESDPSEDKEDSAEDKKRDIIRRPTPKKDPPSKPVSEMTPKERQAYYSAKMDEEYSATTKK